MIINQKFFLMFIILTFLYDFLLPAIHQHAAPQTFTLMTMLYNEKNGARCKEYITCIEKNLHNSSIKHIHVFFDTTTGTANSFLLEYLKKKPVSLTFIKGRATFGDFFSFSNASYDRSPIIIANADIYFDETLKLLEAYDLSNKFIAITRWDILKDGSEQLYMSKWDKNKKQFVPINRDAYNSQDVWIYKTPLKKFKIEKFPLGTQWCDPYIAYQAKQAGLVVLNPCYTIKCHHLHVTGIRHWHWARPIYPHVGLPFTSLQLKKYLMTSLNVQEEDLKTLSLPFDFLE